MSGTILENMSGRKLAILVLALIVCQVICFLIGGFVGMYNCLIYARNHKWTPAQVQQKSFFVPINNAILLFIVLYY